ncbi:hypothetical protein SERLA73DRAFT_77333 [Serpula lacrymans var. lacrymans S7.3]|uniref:Peptidase S54 rhomboid domain-containing protein n=2 Tax=Serpula lacrymans var. lacrymans TaxID=341189 RepID=F8Q9Q5_SERL3|nr:uncharacterized protein SERLADRAFT_442215 [Serpula lacrymans var. lacrymans S7.9]EGN95310.1 hypothetical protein SERLA73DRAFT_77333 [Serpula lacrymans var. lacrymans S7.3]EGO20840.1 hypothetical protein SERLADRAFT_442215 [Serpula lacrymans var. lacrymans S7.9]
MVADILTKPLTHEKHWKFVPVPDFSQQVARRFLQALFLIAVTLSALAFPDASISLIFLPFFAIPIQSGVGAIIALDAIGILRGWKMFDHYAHLSGATFGVLYYLYGPQWWDSMRIIHDPTEEEKEKSEA